MEERYVIGVDLGTESARVGLFTGSGVLIETAAVPYPTTYTNIGWAEHNPERKETKITKLQDLITL